ncbi:MarR family transcriptional regulator [Psychromonas sp. 14N.309.X.WAT.B.A12]|uniref:MarR family transcriptional regulator n=1 Tax=unclassified Psychromonas TaxID=2614957 RepID=UPI0025B10903|nr:MarR family transcriptional regulator [Psychromonas sp. 14N.309.X.WAT.B.A12]MDN2663870.1 MarR family transcriptional regulator [Psychromonas sp. 14N.309.X.WAT.B.A12]
MLTIQPKSPGIPLAKLIGLAHLHKEQLMNQYLAPIGLSSAQFKVLAAIHFYDMNAPVDICKYLSINGGSMTRMVDRLVKKELLEKQPNPEDKRGVLLNLTNTGESLLQQCMDTMENQVGPLLLGDLSVQEVEQLSGLLMRLLPAESV